MTDELRNELQIFAEGAVAEKWDAARRMMAAKALISVADTQEVRIGFFTLGEVARNADGLERLLAIDLIVRVSSLVKSLKPQAENKLSAALARPLPPMSLAADSKELPQEAKPAEIRENIAIGLAHASGEWVIPYVVNALAIEDKSQRCRLELARQLIVREPSVDSCFSALANLPVSKFLPEKTAAVVGASRLKDISSALSEVIRERRTGLKATQSAGAELARLCRAFVSINSRTQLPPKLDQSAAEVARLLDDLLAVRVDLISEAEIYAPLEVFHRWWAPLPYPETLAHSCKPLADKLLGAITMRARWGQRSESLTSRLGQALGNAVAVSPSLIAIAEAESGLTPEIDDWLRGRVREASPTAGALARTLSGVSFEDLVTAIAPMLLEAKEAEDSDGVDAHSDSFVRLVTQVKALATRLKLEISGQVGEAVEYAPTAHRTVTGTLPREPRVKLLRPMVVRRRADGGVDVIEKAIVADS